jgi:hypothetical protein
MEKFGIFPFYPASLLLNESCSPGFIRNWHNHFDNYGNLQPGYCGGISLGDWHELESLSEEGLNLDRKLILNYIINDDFQGLLTYAKKKGYSEREKGYFSKCHLCVDIRKYLVDQDDYEELQPKAFYRFL